VLRRGHTDQVPGRPVDADEIGAGRWREAGLAFFIRLAVVGLGRFGVLCILGVFEFRSLILICSSSTSNAPYKLPDKALPERGIVAAKTDHERRPKNGQYCLSSAGGAGTSLWASSDPMLRIRSSRSFFNLRQGTAEHRGVLDLPLRFRTIACQIRARTPSESCIVLSKAGPFLGLARAKYP